MIASVEGRGHLDQCKEVPMTRRQLLMSARGIVIAVLVMSLAGPRPAFAVGPDKEQAELANAMGNVKVSLQ